MLLTRQVPSKFRKSTGGPMCGRYGTPLLRPGQANGREEEEAVLEYQASKCDAYGEELPPVPLERRFAVSLPMPTMRNQESGPEHETCMSCASCTKFAPADVVEDSLGWATGLCAARGMLVPSNMQTRNAAGCEFKRLGPVLDSIEDLVLFPQYKSGFNMPDKVAQFIEASTAREPSTYVTDQPVTDEHRASGIIAWRRIDEPNGKRFVHLPIYSIEHFSESDQKLIPRTGDDEHPELYIDHFGGVYMAAVCWSELDETPDLIGKAGTGKTELGRHLAWLMQLPFRRVSITGSTELDDLAGKMHYNKEKGTYFEYGRLPKAWKSAGVICIDEPNTGQPDVWQFLRPLTDNSKQLVLDVNEGETISRHDDCYMFMAMNPAWDPINIGANEIGDADVNRLFHIYVPEPPEDVERSIIEARVALDGWRIERADLDMVMGIAHDIRALIDEGGLSISWATRPQIKVARALRWFDPVNAYKRAVADYLEPEARDSILDIVRSHQKD